MSGYNPRVNLPNGEEAIVEDRKLRDYVLNILHPVGRHHAALFRDLLGIGATNSDVLRSALVEAASTESVTREAKTPFGTKYEMTFEVTGPKGRKAVRAVWILDDGKLIPRLVTCFVE